ncbi:MAG: transposase family protein [Okeania sp. SIO2D1]|nr:transposase family protein [Okeania sp. SIO2D1]
MLDYNYCWRRHWVEKWPGQNVKNESIEEFITRFPSVKEVMIDGTERPIQRPQDQQKQKDHYSGKKKRHTSQHLILTDRERPVLVLSLMTRG